MSDHGWRPELGPESEESSRRHLRLVRDDEQQSEDLQQQAAHDFEYPYAPGESFNQAENQLRTAVRLNKAMRLVELSEEDKALLRRNPPAGFGSGSDMLKDFLTAIGTVPVLNHDEEVRLSKMVQKGIEADEALKVSTDNRELQAHSVVGRVAKDRFIEANLRLVVSKAKRYPYNDSFNLMDLIQEGTIGLRRAVEKFDWQLGFKFSTYASTWIDQSVGRAVKSKMSLVYLPDQQSIKFKQDMDAAEGNATKLSSEASRIHRLIYQDSLDAPVGNNENSSLLGDTVADNIYVEDDAIQLQESEELMKAISRLEPVQQEVLIARFGLKDGRDRSIEEIADLTGLKKDNVRRRIKQGIQLLHSIMSDHDS